METYYLGVDPGIGGGIAVISLRETFAVKMPDTEEGIWDFVSGYSTSDDVASYAVIEKVGGYVAGDYNRPAMGASQFVFGTSYGMCLMALIAAGIKVEKVHSRTWQRDFIVKQKKSARIKLSYAERKRRLKAIAQELYPTLKVTLKTADALLLATYCKRQYD